ncbi:MAG: hypothetical protein WCA11_07195 [Terracidiphilus sp.]
MTQNIYRTTFDEAGSELNEVLARMEQLRQHQQLIERAIEALEPYCAVNAESVATIQPSVTTIPAEFVRHEPAPEPIPFPVQEVVANFDAPQSEPVPEPTADPVASRINSALWDWNLSAARLQTAS